MFEKSQVNQPNQGHQPWQSNSLTYNAMLCTIDYQSGICKWIAELPPNFWNNMVGQYVKQNMGGVLPCYAPEPKLSFLYQRILKDAMKHIM